LNYEIFQEEKARIQTHGIEINKNNKTAQAAIAKSAV
jgi:hypothetical protein